MASAPRSGTQVKETVKTSSLVATLLAPFVHLLVVKLEAVTGMQLGTAYEAQVLMGVGALIVWASAHWRMAQVAKDEPPADPLGLG